jgi:hypothetical protein
MTSDAAHIKFMTMPGAHLLLRLEVDPLGHPEVLLVGNRAGLLSLANILLWFHATAWRRELLSFGDLPFAKSEGRLAIHIRVANDDATGKHGVVERLDRGEQFEWTIPADDLQAVGLLVHGLAADPDNGYERLRLESWTDVGIHVCIDDVGQTRSPSDA